MTLQLSTSCRNDRVAAIETNAGTAPIVRIRTSSVPATPATADAGTVLLSITLGSDWASQTGGILTFSSTPLSGTASGTGTAGHFRLYKSDGTTVVAQGTVTATGGGGDMTIDNTSIVTGQTVQITAWTITDGNV